MSADLHLHSSYSDGSNMPAELVALAASQDLKTIALTDHDTVKGIAEAMRAGQDRGVEVIPAIELSTSGAGGAEIHILGYYLDYQSEYLSRKLTEIMETRLNRAQIMIAKLNQLGIAINYEDVVGIAGDQYIGRPHIAQAMVKAGYIKKPQQAFTEEFIGNGGKAYVEKSQLSPENAIKIILYAGGIPVLAHPFFINKGVSYTNKEIHQLTRAGLAGIEVFHSKHDLETTRYYLRVAGELNLLVTGGSDFHGANSPGIEIGAIRIDDSFVDQLKEYRSND